MKICIFQTIKKSLRFSLKVSSVSELNYLLNDGKRTLFERIFWLVIILTMATFATLQAVKVFNHYKERPVIVTVDKSVFNWKLGFPSVTICYQELKFSEKLDKIIHNIVDKYNLSMELLTTEQQNFHSYLYDLAFKNYTNYEDYELYAKGIKKEYLRPEQYMEVLGEIVMDDMVDGKSKIDTPRKENRTILRVFTEQGPCMVLNPNISIYYTSSKFFNSNNYYSDYEPIKYNSREQLRFSVGKPSKFSNNGSTIYVHFHEPNEIMELMDRKQYVHHGYYFEIKYKSEIVRTSEEVLPLSVKQKNCRLPLETDDIPSLAHSPVYSHNLCKIECRILISMKYCNCTPYYYRRTSAEPICNLTGLYCLSKYKNALIFINDTSVNCPVCPQNCDGAVYKPFIGRNYEVKESTIIEATLSFPDQIYIRNLVFSKTDLTVQIGGIFSLFLGCSLLSFVEVIYSFTLRLLCSIILDKKRSN